MLRSIILLFISLAVSSAYAAAMPTPDPVKFFTGHTRSVGVFENHHGEPTLLVKTETWGRLVNGELHMEQELFVGSQPRTHRSWKIHRIGARHFEATASDVLDGESDAFLRPGEHQFLAVFERKDMKVRAAGSNLRLLHVRFGWL